MNIIYLDFCTLQQLQKQPSYSLNSFNYSLVDQTQVNLPSIVTQRAARDFLGDSGLFFIVLRIFNILDIS